MIQVKVRLQIIPQLYFHSGTSHNDLNIPWNSIFIHQLSFHVCPRTQDKHTAHLCMSHRCPEQTPLNKFSYSLLHRHPKSLWDLIRNLGTTPLRQGLCIGRDLLSQTLIQKSQYTTLLHSTINQTFSLELIQCIMNVIIRL